MTQQRTDKINEVSRQFKKIMQRDMNAKGMKEAKRMAFRSYKVEDILATVLAIG